MTVIAYCPVTFLLHFFPPHASSLRYLPFSSLIFHTYINKITIIEDPVTVIPDRTKLTASSYTEYVPNLSTYSLYFMVWLITFVYLLYWDEPGKHFPSTISFWWSKQYVLLLYLLGEFLFSWNLRAHTKMWSDPLHLGFYLYMKNKW